MLPAATSNARICPRCITSEMAYRAEQEKLRQQLLEEKKNRITQALQLKRHVTGAAAAARSTASQLKIAHAKVTYSNDKDLSPNYVKIERPPAESDYTLLYPPPDIGPGMEEWGKAAEDPPLPPDRIREARLEREKILDAQSREVDAITRATAELKDLEGRRLRLEEVLEDSRLDVRHAQLDLIEAEKEKGMLQESIQAVQEDLRSLREKHGKALEEFRVASAKVEAEIKDRRLEAEKEKRMLQEAIETVQEDLRSLREKHGKALEEFRVASAKVGAEIKDERITLENARRELETLRGEKEFVMQQHHTALLGEHENLKRCSLQILEGNFEHLNPNFSGPPIAQEKFFRTTKRSGTFDDSRVSLACFCVTLCNQATMTTRSDSVDKALADKGLVQMTRNSHYTIFLGPDHVRYVVCPSTVDFAVSENAPRDAVIRLYDKFFVHSAYFQNASGLFETLSEWMDGGSKRHEVIFCGHGSGGAVAALSAIHWLHPKVHCVTLGSPPYGNEELRQYLFKQNALNRFHHVIYRNDAVPRKSFFHPDHPNVKLESPGVFHFLDIPEGEPYWTTSDVEVVNVILDIVAQPNTQLVNKRATLSDVVTQANLLDNSLASYESALKGMWEEFG